MTPHEKAVEAAQEEGYALKWPDGTELVEMWQMAKDLTRLHRHVPVVPLIARPEASK